MTIRSIVGSLILVALASGAGALAQSYPDRPVNLVAPYSAGSGIDIMSRIFAEDLTRRLGQPVIVDNRPGAGGNLGSDYVARAKPDGYTLLITSNGLPVAPALYKNVAFDPVKDFAHVAKLATGSMTLVVNPEALDVSSLDALVGKAKATPGKLNYSSAGNGTPHHLDMELLKRRFGLEITHIPYSGATGALNDLLAGHVQLAMFPVNVVLPFVKAGKLRAIAVSGKGRSLLAPEAPTFDELGLNDLDLDVYYFISAPARTPQPIVERLNAAIVAMMREPTMKERLLSLGLVPDPSSPATIAALIAADTARWKEFIPAAHITAD